MKNIFNFKKVKSKFFKKIHECPIEIWIMWSTLILFILVSLIKIYYIIIDESEIQQYIMKL